jgi:cation:H+ antiporter
MIVSVVLLLLSAAVIYVSCEFFVNGVEWSGRRLGVTQSAVGTVLAAFGTALSARRFPRASSPLSQ